MRPAVLAYTDDVNRGQIWREKKEGEKARERGIFQNAPYIVFVEPPDFLCRKSHLTARRINFRKLTKDKLVTTN